MSTFLVVLPWRRINSVLPHVAGIPTYMNHRYVQRLKTIVMCGEWLELVADTEFHGPFLLPSSELWDA